MNKMLLSPIISQSYCHPLSYPLYPVFFAPVCVNFNDRPNWHTIPFFTRLCLPHPLHLRCKISIFHAPVQ